MTGRKRSDGQTDDGLMVSSNHFVHPDWEFTVPTDADSWNSLARRANMITRAVENKEKNDVRSMKAIMSTPIENGGPYHDLTRYQMVVEPGNMTIHLKLSCNENWVELPMSLYLRARQ